MLAGGCDLTLVYWWSNLLPMILFNLCLDFQALPQYTLAHERAVYKAVSIVADTKTIVKELDIASLGEMRGMQKPDVDIEDLMAAIIMICEYLVITVYATIFEQLFTECAASTASSAVIS